MKIFLCGTTVSSGIIAKVERIICEWVQESAPRLFENVEDFAAELRKPCGGDAIAVLIAADRSELERFIALRSLLDKVRIIQVFVDSTEEMAPERHMLSPRFATYADDLSMLGPVLKKMTSSLAKPTD